MQFQVPQFIEHETKVVGPFTFKQFVFMAIPGAFAFFFYFTASFKVFLMATAMLLPIGFGLAFIRVGGKSLPEILLNILSFSINPKTYIWKGGPPADVAGKRGREQIDTLQTYAQTEQQQIITGQIKLGKKN